MTAKAKIRPASEVAELLRPIDSWTMTRYLQGVAVDHAIEEAQREINGSIQSVPFAFDAEIGRVAEDLIQRSESPPFRRLSGLLAIKATLDACPDLPAIRKRLEPLFAEYHAACRNEAEAARVASAEAQERRAKLEAAKAAALAKIEQDFASVG